MKKFIITEELKTKLNTLIMSGRYDYKLQDIAAVQVELINAPEHIEPVEPEKKTKK